MSNDPSDKTTEELLEALRDILYDEELSEELMMSFLNIFEELDSKLVLGDDFPQDWLELRTSESNN